MLGKELDASHKITVEPLLRLPVVRLNECILGEEHGRTTFFWQDPLEPNSGFKGLFADDRI